MPLKDILLKAKKMLFEVKDGELMEADVVTRMNEGEKDDLVKSEFVDDSISNIYRLHHIEYLNIGENYGYKMTGMRDYTFRPFLMPEGLDEKDAFKILSYLTDFLERNLNITEGSLKSVIALNKVLDLKRFGFKRVTCQNDDNRLKDLFTIYGRTERFDKSKYCKKYFEWYTENVTKEEVEKIYNKIGMEFKDIVILEKGTENLDANQVTIKDIVGKQIKDKFGMSYDEFESLEISEQHRLIEEVTGKKVSIDCRSLIDGIPIVNDHIKDIDDVDKRIVQITSDGQKRTLKKKQ